jgi:hypothetical protein
MSAKCKYRSDTRSAIGNREGALANAAYLRGERKNPAPNTIKDSIDTVRDNCAPGPGAMPIQAPQVLHMSAR